MQGIIIKGIGGFYYVNVPDAGLYECKAKGAFRAQNMKPMVGDRVVIDVLDEEKKLGNLTEILQRNNVLVRPAVANVNQAMIVFAVASPTPNLNLLARFLLLMNRQQVKTVICFNKLDLDEKDYYSDLSEIYAHCGCQVLGTSTRDGRGIDAVRAVLNDKTTVLAGPSGVGKSSLLNAVFPEADVKTGEISRKIQRGKHTTRHSELIHITGETYLMDTPGFSTLYIDTLDPKELEQLFFDFQPYREQCRFQGCSHINEPDCGVKEALANGKLHPARYESYTMLYKELQSKRRW